VTRSAPDPESMRNGCRGGARITRHTFGRARYSLPCPARKVRGYRHPKTGAAAGIQTSQGRRRGAYPAQNIGIARNIIATVKITSSFSFVLLLKEIVRRRWLQFLPGREASRGKRHYAIEY